MPQTLQNGVVVPINPDAYNLAGDLATMGNKSNVVIPVANQAARDALTLAPGLTVTRLDLPGAPIQTYDGTTWQGGIWFTYTPAITASTNPSLGSGSQQLGQYQLNGKVMSVQFFVAWGTGGTNGSGSFSVSLPTGFTYAGVGSAPSLGTVRAHNANPVDMSGYLTLSSAGASSMSGYWQNGTTASAAFGSGTLLWTNGGYLTGSATVFLA